MTHPSHPRPPDRPSPVLPDPAADGRVDDLLADRTLFGLTPEEEAELASLTREGSPAAFDDLELTAAAVALSALSTAAARPEPLPAGLRARILADAPTHLPPVAERPSSPTGPRTPTAVALRAGASPGVAWRHFAVGGWVAAAASLVFAVTVWRSAKPTEPPAEEGFRGMAARVGTDPDVLRLEWSAGNDPDGASAGGELVWSVREQAGYMRFRGLPANDPRRTQYQLWIFDSARDGTGAGDHPVDGGVFDIASAGGDVIVPIRAKLRVDRPKLFAVTIERPGGVVVSEKKRIPLLAPVKAPPASG
jgi:hypothetical protein